MLKKIKFICIVFVCTIISSHVMAMDAELVSQSEAAPCKPSVLDTEPLIHVAVIKRDLNEIQRLVEQEHVDVNEKSPTYSYTPLHRAILFYSVCKLEAEKTNQRNIIHYLVEHGAQESVCAEDHRRRTPLHMELNRWDTDVELLELLLQKGRPSKDLIGELILYKTDKDQAIACLLKHIDQEPVCVVDAEKRRVFHEVLNEWKVDVEHLRSLLEGGQAGQDLIAELIRYQSSSDDRAAVDCLLKHLMCDDE